MWFNRPSVDCYSSTVTYCYIVHPKGMQKCRLPSTLTLQCQRKRDEFHIRLTGTGKQRAVFFSACNQTVLRPITLPTFFFSESSKRANKVRAICYKGSSSNNLMTFLHYRQYFKPNLVEELKEIGIETVRRWTYLHWIRKNKCWGHGASQFCANQLTSWHEFWLLHSSP